MDKKNDGGPAFPQQEGFDEEGAPQGYRQAGMSLRDWLAGQAAVGYLNSGPLSLSEHERGMTFGELVAHRSYLLADAMLKERSK